MEGTYTRVGDCSGNLIYPLFYVALLVIEYFLSRHKGSYSRQEKINRLLYFGCILGFACLPVPDELFLALNTAFFGGRFGEERTPKQLFGVILVGTIVFLGPRFMGREKRSIVLDDRVLIDRQESRETVMSRKGLRLVAGFRNEDPLTVWGGVLDWYVISFRDTGSLELRGTEIYWGPRGLIVGQDLGKQMIRWSKSSGTDDGSS